MIYTLTLLGLLLLLLGGIWKYRLDLLEYLPPSVRSKLRHYAPVQTFEAAMEAGFSSSSFNLAENAGDSRLGMDERSLTEVRRIMEELGCSFDDARLTRNNRHFKANGIDEFGFPLDPKAITSLS